MIYLDSASTEKLHPKAKEALIQSFEVWANPSGISEASKKAAVRLEICRKEIKSMLNVKNNAELIFTSSASESNNIVFNTSPHPILISKFEHPSVYNHPKVVGKIELDLQSLEKKLQEQKYLVSVSLVNNESGMILLNHSLIELIKKYESKLHIDASQAKKINFEELNCDYMTISSHKIGGPIGVAGLITKTLLPPVIYGGGQEFNIRSGTQALPLIEGFTAAVKELNNRVKNDCFLNEIMKKNIDSKYFFSNFVAQNFANHIVCLLTYDRSGTEIQAYMDMHDITIAYGSACSSGAMNAPMILTQFALPSTNGIRVSFGWQTTDFEVLKFCSLFNDFL